MIIRNTILNAAGLFVPGLLFIPAAAFLARALGVEQFGLLLLMYAILGYSGIFDAGMTRAVVRKIAQSKSIKEDKYVMGTSLYSVFVFSAIPMLLIKTFSSDIINLLKVSENNIVQGEMAVEVLAFIIPFFLITAVAFSYLEGKEYFLKLSCYKLITGVFLALMPAFLVYLNGTLSSAVIGLLLARIITASIALTSLSINLGLKGLRFDKQTFIHLFTFGGWVSVSNIISPVMVYMDKFILSNTVGANAVAFYNAPSDLIQKISIIPSALARTIFPFFSRLGSHSSITAQLYFGLLLVLSLILLPLYFMAEMVLDFWLGVPYGENSSSILQVLIIGFLFNALAQIPFASIQAKGHSRFTALLHLAEVLPYLILLFYLVDKYGLIGAAYAWSARVFLIFCAFFIIQNLKISIPGF